MAARWHNDAARPPGAPLVEVAEAAHALGGIHESRGQRAHRHHPARAAKAALNVIDDLADRSDARDLVQRHRNVEAVFNFGDELDHPHGVAAQIDRHRIRRRCHLALEHLRQQLAKRGVNIGRGHTGLRAAMMA